MEAKVDHAPSLNTGRRHYHSIVELVTAPRDEYAMDFFEPMEEAVVLAKRLEKVVGSGKRAPAAEAFGGGTSELHIGVDLGDGEAQFQDVSAFPQATYGLRLPAVERLLQNRVHQHNQHSRDGRMYLGALDAIGRAAGPLSALGISRDATPHLWGYLGLVCLYLASGTVEKLGVNKNAVPLLVRTHFGQVTSSCVPGREAELLRVHGKPIFAILLGATGRDDGDKLAPGLKVSVGSWLKAALDGGVIDPLWSEWDLSREILPERVGPKRDNIGPVMEERAVPPAGVRIRPDQWLPLAASYHHLMQDLNVGPEPPNTKSPTSESMTESNVSNSNSNSETLPVITIQIPPPVVHVKLTAFPKVDDVVYLDPAGQQPARVFWANPENGKIIVTLSTGKKPVTMTDLYR